MKQSVVAIGNFDGVHLGHQDVLAQARTLADAKGYDFTVLTFTPHPKRFFQPDRPPFRLAPDAVKRDLFDRFIKPDHYIVLDFNDGLQHMTPEAFMQDILIEQLNAAVVSVGRNFRFGYQRAGDLQTLSDNPAFETLIDNLMEIGGEAVSSTRIRDHLRKAEIAQANALLGWDWYIQGEVIHGDKRGRELGFPTTNMVFGDTLVPAHGIYAVRVLIEGESEWRHGAANIGTRPMFETDQPLLETYIFDFDGDLYGKTLKVQPVRKIRDEMKFDGIDALVTQMQKDCDIAKNILNNM